jgi:hypothetical protein
MRFHKVQLADFQYLTQNTQHELKKKGALASLPSEGALAL